MRDQLSLAVTAILLLVCFGGPGKVGAATAYVPIRHAVAGGTYHTPNYLSVVSSAIGRDHAYQMFSGVVAEKYPHIVGRFGNNEVLVRALQKQRVQRAQLLGHYAEDRFVEMNRDAGWKKVNNRFAPQRDVWRRIDGRVEYGQIKVHGLGRSATTMRELAAGYINSMRKDSGRGQARLFLVPDDHIDSIKGLIEERHTAAVRRGDSGQSTWLLKQRGRLARLGVSYETLSSEADLAQHAGRRRIVARHAGPVITVVFLAGSTGYETYKWSSGQSSGAAFAVQVGKTGSVVTLGFATNYLVLRSEFLMASPYRAGGVVTAVVFLAVEGWLIYDHGGFSNAFSSPAFYVKSGGNLGAFTLGLIGSIEGLNLGAMIGAPGGWTAFIGAGIGGIAGGIAGGLVGYLGGAAMTDWMLETFSPEFYYGMKLEEIDKAEKKLARKIDRLRDLSHPLTPIAFSQ